MVQNIIQCHDNNIWKHMCIKSLCYITETYLRYYVQRGNTGRNLHMSSTSRIGPIPTNMNVFCYVPENEIEGEILGWNLFVSEHYKLI